MNVCYTCFTLLLAAGILPASGAEISRTTGALLDEAQARIQQEQVADFHRRASREISRVEFMIHGRVARLEPLTLHKAAALRSGKPLRRSPRRGGSGLTRHRAL